MVLHTPTFSTHSIFGFLFLDIFEMGHWIDEIFPAFRLLSEFQRKTDFLFEFILWHFSKQQSIKCTCKKILKSSLIEIPRHIFWRSHVTCQVYIHHLWNGVCSRVAPNTQFNTHNWMQIAEKGLVLFLVVGRDGVNLISMEKMNTFPNKHMR